ncbi:MAG: 3-deoxy-8-phosphooctulonate synthase [Simkaniaceae bacterium]|nr:3-deoxy-8-phosphooctulonate synthase [Simkaniaceae bacterium]
MKKLKIMGFEIGPNCPLTVISGPCVIESEAQALETAEQLQTIFDRLGIQLVYKSSFDKANRLSVNSYRGVGMEKGLQILESVKSKFSIPILTDVHTTLQAKEAAAVCDILQIPALLCRQTDLLIAAAQTGVIINLKKGQFMAPWDMKNLVDKILSTKNDQIILTDRGTSFGYNNLVSDMRAIPIMQKFGYPVCFDASHSVQLPGGLGDSSGGQREFIPTLAKAAIAAGANLLFIESHPDPKTAKSDGASVMAFNDLEELLKEIKPLYELIHNLRSYV